MADETERGRYVRDGLENQERWDGSGIKFRDKGIKVTDRKKGKSISQATQMDSMPGCMLDCI